MLQTQTHFEQLGRVWKAIRRVVMAGIDGVGQRRPFGKRAEVCAIGAECKLPGVKTCTYFPLLVSSFTIWRSLQKENVVRINRADRLLHPGIPIQQSIVLLIGRLVQGVKSSHPGVSSKMLVFRTCHHIAHTCAKCSHRLIARS